MFDQKVAGELTSHSLISGFEKILTIIALGLPEGQHCLAFTITTIRSNWLYRVAKIPTPALEFSWTKSVHCHQAPSNSAVHYRAMLVERNNITWGKCMWLCRWYWNRVIRIKIIQNDSLCYGSWYQTQNYITYPIGWAEVPAQLVKGQTTVPANCI